MHVKDAGNAGGPQNAVIKRNGKMISESQADTVTGFGNDIAVNET
jgi:hypothetical protein